MIILFVQKYICKLGK